MSTGSPLPAVAVLTENKRGFIQIEMLWWGLGKRGMWDCPGLENFSGI